MATSLNVVKAPRDTAFQLRMNSEIKKEVEEIYAQQGMTLTDAFNIFIQQSLNAGGLPIVLNSKKDEE